MAVNNEAVKTTSLETAVQLIQLANVALPSVLAIVALLKDKTATFEQMLADADATENSEIEKLKGELAADAPTPQS